MNRVRAVAAVLLLSFMLSLTACDGGEKKMIVGTWKQAPGNDTEFLGSTSRSTWTFNADGTYKEEEVMTFITTSIYVKTGKYELDTKENYIILKPDDGWHDDTFGDQEIYYEYTLTESYLTLKTGLGTERYNKVS